MSKEIKNQILEAASKKGEETQRIDYKLLPYATEMNKEGMIQMVGSELPNAEYLQVMLTTKGLELLESGGYK